MSISSETPATSSSRSMRIVVVVVLVLLVGSLGYQWWSARQSAVVPSARTTRDFVVTWRCLSCDRVIEDRAGPGPKKCPGCGKDEMYASLRWGCPTHGVQQVAFQYDEEGQPTRVKVGRADWVPAYGEQGWNIRCPSCGGAMNPAEIARPAE
ncbi:MAG: hypothetical protein GX616_19580 [Planctomycetes bacterium]|nr:hypothetical protein [Planctomycetota bacterium]